MSTSADTTHLCSTDSPIAAKKSLPRKGNPGLLARKIILKSGWMGMDVGRLLMGEPSVQFQREDKKQAKSAETLINIRTYVRTYSSTRDALLNHDLSHVPHLSMSNYWHAIRIHSTHDEGSV